jgi:hypothetical protein
LVMRVVTEAVAGLSSTSSSQGETIMNGTRYLPFAGRLLIGLAFTMSGLSKLAGYSATIDLILSSKLPSLRHWPTWGPSSSRLAQVS